MRTVLSRSKDLEVLVTIYDDGEVEVATRMGEQNVWSPPLDNVRDEERP